MKYIKILSLLENEIRYDARQNTLSAVNWLLSVARVERFLELRKHKQWWGWLRTINPQTNSHLETENYYICSIDSVFLITISMFRTIYDKRQWKCFAKWNTSKIKTCRWITNKFIFLLFQLSYNVISKAFNF